MLLPYLGVFVLQQRCLAETWNSIRVGLSMICLCNIPRGLEPLALLPPCLGGSEALEHQSCGLDTRGSHENIHQESSLLRTFRAFKCSSSVFPVTKIHSTNSLFGADNICKYFQYGQTWKVQSKTLIKFISVQVFGQKEE